MMSYDIDEFEELMESSRLGGWNMRSLRNCRSLPTSPITSPKRSPEVEIKGEMNMIGDYTINEETQDTTTYSNLLLPPDPFPELQTQSNGTAGGGARPKMAATEQNSLHTAPPVTGGIRRTQSCRRPTTAKKEQTATKREHIAATKREHTPFSYRQRAHANAWRQHANTTSTDDETENKPPVESPIDESEFPAQQRNDDDGDLQDCKIYRVRSFRTTSSGIVNHGDSFKVKSRRQSSKHRTPKSIHGRRFSTDTNGSLSSRDDLMSDSPLHLPKGLSSESPGPSRPTMLNIHDSPKSDSLMPYLIQEEQDSNTTERRPSADGFESTGSVLEPEIEVEDGNDEPDDDDEDNPVYKVLMIGTQGVGKSTLTRQLLTSEYLANTDRYQDDDQEQMKIVSVMLDDEESMVQFVNVQNFQEAQHVENVDAYIVVFSVTDRNSFSYAQACLQDLARKGSPSRKKVIIVVANKQDSMRNRAISEQEGRSLATHRHSKYTEVSALLDHKVDELLVGIIRQIRIKQAKLHQNLTSKAPGEPRRIGCLQRAAMGLFRRLFRKRGSGKANCDNLLSP